MKTERKLLTGTLLALCGALLALCIVLAAGWSKAAKTDTALPEVRNSGTAIQWKYSDEADWRDLVALSELRGAAGENGKDGANGKDGKDGVNGENGTDGKNGINGTNGKDGISSISKLSGNGSTALCLSTHHFLKRRELKVKTINTGYMVRAPTPCAYRGRKPHPYN